MNYAIGIDIGSTCAKAAVVDETGALCLSLVQPTGWSSVDTAQAIYAKLEELGINMHLCIQLVVNGLSNIVIAATINTYSNSVRANIHALNNHGILVFVFKHQAIQHVFYCPDCPLQGQP